MAQWKIFIDSFLMSEKALFLGKVDKVVIVKMKDNLFGKDIEVLLKKSLKSVSQSIIIHTEDQAVVSFELQDYLVKAISDGRFFDTNSWMDFLVF